MCVVVDRVLFSVLVVVDRLLFKVVVVVVIESARGLSMCARIRVQLTCSEDIYPLFIVVAMVVTPISNDATSHGHRVRVKENIPESKAKQVTADMLHAFQKVRSPVTDHIHQLQNGNNLPINPK